MIVIIELFKHQHLSLGALTDILYNNPGSENTPVMFKASQGLDGRAETASSRPCFRNQGRVTTSQHSFPRTAIGAERAPDCAERER